MKKKITLLIVILITLTGCTKVSKLSYDEIVNTVINIKKEDNVYRKGYKFYLPNGLKISDAGTNYVILSSKDLNYYLYVDFVSYINNSKNNYTINENAYYSNVINYNNLDGYVEINLIENNKYLIEIMYNYAKIEVMVDDDQINSALVNTINILKSINYNATIIEKLLADDKLDYTEEKFDIFENSNNNSSVLTHEDGSNNENTEDIIKDTDFLN